MCRRDCQHLPRDCFCYVQTSEWLSLEQNPSNISQSCTQGPSTHPSVAAKNVCTTLTMRVLLCFLMCSWKRLRQPFHISASIHTGKTCKFSEFARGKLAQALTTLKDAVLHRQVSRTQFSMLGAKFCNSSTLLQVSTLAFSHRVLHHR